MELLKQLYTINSRSGNEVAIRQLILEMLRGSEVLVNVDFLGNVYITKGVASPYPCLAAHLDEVHSPENRLIEEFDGIVSAKNELGELVGLGADDKNGIWIALQLLQELPDLKVAFFVEEERKGDLNGCRGAHVADLSFFSDCKYIIECDRKGRSDFVVEGRGIPLCPPDFIPGTILEKFGYEPVQGGRTDVVELKMRGLDIPVCNLSCGYYNAHQCDEYTNLYDLQNALSFVREVLMTI
jgi:putative aminopeptidase FrvX